MFEFLSQNKDSCVIKLPSGKELHMSETKLSGENATILHLHTQETDWDCMENLPSNTENGVQLKLAYRFDI